MNANKKSRILNAGLALALAALACNMPSGQPTPTFTPEAATETATPAPSPTIDAAAQECIATANRDVNMRTGPGTAWPVVSQLAGGNSAKVTGHNGDQSWWQLNNSAWVSAPFTTTSGDCSGILVVGFPPAPTKKAADQDQPDPDQNQPDPTQAPPQPPAPQPPTNTPVSVPVVNVAFEIDFNTSWTCGSAGRISFIMWNQGNVPIESVYYSVEYPTGTYINSGTVNNTPFKANPTETQPGCTQAGQDSLATGQGRYIPINISPIPPGGAEGFLYIEACSQNGRSGVCKSQILYFHF